MFSNSKMFGIDPRGGSANSLIRQDVVNNKFEQERSKVKQVLFLPRVRDPIIRPALLLSLTRI